MAAILSIEPFDAYRLDGLIVDTLILPLHEGAVTSAGAAGWLDWRLSGRLSRMLLDGRFAAARGERMMLAYPGRIGPTRAILYGLGPHGAAAAHLEEDSAAVARLLDAAGALKVAVGPPEPGAAEWLEAWLGTKGITATSARSILFLDASGELAEARTALDKAAKRRGIELA